MKYSLLLFMKILCGFSLLTTSLNASDDQRLADEEELYTGKEYSNAFQMPQDNPELPNILLIGDSISIGYTVEVRKLLKDKADVFRIPTNGKMSAFGAKNINKWLGRRHWDVIHFNWGLWDVCYRNPEAKTQGHRDKVNGTLTATPEEYRKNLEKIVKRLTETKAQLVWCATTPVPKKELGRKVGDEIQYNAIASEIMKKYKVQVNDLHAHALLKSSKIQKKEGDVHFNAEGYTYLAQKVSDEVLLALKKK